jgi:ABC-type branched-subunit amino acid transport system ATPase component
MNPLWGLVPLIIEILFQKLADLNREGVTILLVEQNAVMALEFRPPGLCIGNRPDHAFRDPAGTWLVMRM